MNLKTNVIGLDIGGTKIFAGRYNQDLDLEAETKEPTAARQDRATTLGNILQAIESVRTQDTKSIGISWAGFVDNNRGIIKKSANIPSLDGFCITDYVTEQTGLPAYLENDARLFAFAESAAHQHPPVFLGIIIGTGVGSGIILEGNILHGTHNSAGEIGHTQLHGKTIESVISGPSLEKELGVVKLFNADIATHKTQIEQAKKNLCDWLGNLVLTFDPSHIVIGGGAGIHFWSQFEAAIVQETNIRLQNFPVSLNLSFSELKNAGAQGAAVLAWSQTK